MLVFPKRGNMIYPQVMGINVLSLMIRLSKSPVKLCSHARQLRPIGHGLRQKGLIPPPLRLLLLLLHLHYLFLHVSLYLPPSDFYFYYCIFYIYINMCTCVHSLPQDSTSSTLSTTSTFAVARLPSLDSSPPHMSQSPLRAESAVFAIQ